MDKLIKSHVVAVMDENIDTDIIYPARYLNTFDEAETASHLFEDVDPGFRDKVKNGGVIFAGKNFGCGSAREQAAMALLYAGVTLVAAKSYNRSFYRNAINNGLPLLEISEDAVFPEMGDELEISFADGRIMNKSKGSEVSCMQPGSFIRDVVAAGGIGKYYKLL